MAEQPNRRSRRSGWTYFAISFVPMITWVLVTRDWDTQPMLIAGVACAIVVGAGTWAYGTYEERRANSVRR